MKKLRRSVAKSIDHAVTLSFDCTGCKDVIHDTREID
jgi:hypothetical protein